MTSLPAMRATFLPPARACSRMAAAAARSPALSHAIARMIESVGSKETPPSTEASRSSQAAAANGWFASSDSIAASSVARYPAGV